MLKRVIEGAGASCSWRGLATPLSLLNVRPHLGAPLSLIRLRLYCGAFLRQSRDTLRHPADYVLSTWRQLINSFFSLACRNFSSDTAAVDVTRYAPATSPFNLCKFRDSSSPPAHSSTNVSFLILFVSSDETYDLISQLFLSWQSTDYEKK